MGLTVLPRSRGARALTGIAICALAAAAGLHDGVLYLLPALLLLGAVAPRRYPGERALLGLALRRARRPMRRRRPAGRRPPARLARPEVPRGGLLIASFLAVRPPPACCVHG